SPPIVDASPQKSRDLVNWRIDKIYYYQLVIPLVDWPPAQVQFDQNIQFLICRSAHLEPQCVQVSPGLPAGNRPERRPQPHTSPGLGLPLLRWQSSHAVGAGCTRSISAHHPRTTEP